MNVLTESLKHKIQQNIIGPLLQQAYETAIPNIPLVLDELYANIPDNKRISYGRVHTIKVLAQYLYTQLWKKDAPIFQIATAIFDKSAEDRTLGVVLGILSFYGVDDGYQQILPYFEKAAASDEWEKREFSQMFFRKIIKTYPEEMQQYFLRLVKSKDANIRRFVAEGLRPCIENQWFYKHPEYPLKVLRRLFQEKVAYPRTSVGNNLSDLARRLPELVYELVEELVESGDKNSYWIAYRACRNLVKKEPIRVMDLLKVDEYRYKKRVHKRRDYQGN